MKRNVLKLKMATVVVALVRGGFTNDEYSQEKGDMAAGTNVGMAMGDGDFNIGWKF